LRFLEHVNAARDAPDIQTILSCSPDSNGGRASAKLYPVTSAAALGAVSLLLVDAEALCVLWAGVGRMVGYTLYFWKCA